jgi:hypothetical protein
MPEEGELADRGEESEITYDYYCSLGKDSVGSNGFFLPTLVELLVLSVFHLRSIIAVAADCVARSSCL